VRRPAAVVGLMVHRALEAWQFPGDAGLEAELEAVALGEGLVDRKQRQAVVAEAARLLARLRSHPMWEEISTADERHHEVPYTRSLGEQRVDSGVIDLLYRKGSEWRLIDFKIDELCDIQALQAERAAYRGQLERYTEAVRTPLGVPVTPGLGFLDCMGEVRVEWRGSQISPVSQR